MSTLKYRLIEGDSLTALDTVPDLSCRLILTSPPYNIGKEYERDRRLTLDEYFDWIRPIIEKLVNKLAIDGSVCWQSGNFIDSGEVYPLDTFFYSIFKELGLKLRNRIIWHFNFGLHAQNRFSGRYETILWFSRGDDYLFNLDPVRVPQKYPGKRHSAKKGVRAGGPSGNPLGKNPSDFWEFDASAAFKLDPIWDFPNVKSNHPEKTQHPCQFPSELAERCILALTNAGDVVLDPFVGSGTTAIAAAMHGREAIGIDRDARYVKLADYRLALLERGELPMRPMGTPLYQPAVGDRVARVPDEWLHATSVEEALGEQDDGQGQIVGQEEEGAEINASGARRSTS